MRCGCTDLTKISVVFCSLLFVGFSIPAAAQLASSAGVGRGVSLAYDAARETTLAGTIEQVVGTHQSDQPAGMHLMISGPQGMEDACVGPFLSEQAKAALQAGIPVQLIGSTMQLHDKEYFLVRELTVGSHTIVVRNQRGFLINRHLNRVSHVKATAASAAKGGQQ